MSARFAPRDEKVQPCPGNSWNSWPRVRPGRSASKPQLVVAQATALLPPRGTPDALTGGEPCCGFTPMSARFAPRCLLCHAAAHASFALLALAALLGASPASAGGTPRRSHLAARARRALGVTVTPNPGVAPERSPYTNGYAAFFTVKNTGTQSDTYTFSCGASSNVTCLPPVPISATLGPGNSTSVQVTYNVGAQGAGWVQLTAEGANGVGNGAQTIPVGRTLLVTPDGAVEPTRRANTGSDSTVFTVRNADRVSLTYSLTCTGSANVTCGTVNPSSLTLAAGVSGSVTVHYSVGPAGAGTLSLTAA